MDWLRCGHPCRSVIDRCARRTRMIVVILVGLLGVWMIGSVECGRNCASYDIRCVNGQCVDESQTSKARPNDTRSSYGGNKTPKVSCLCDPLWSGLGCDVFSCSGRTHLQLSSGVITDGSGNYTTDNKCTWLIDGGSDLPIRLKFKEFATECGWDHLYIFDGTSVSAPLIGVLSGLIIPQNSPDYIIPELTASSGFAYLYFYSDAAYNMSGFTIEYKYALCSKDCAGHGKCLTNGSCLCDDGWTGLSCDSSICPGNCSVPNGICRSDSCHCNSGFKGEDCSIPSYKGYWSVVKYEDRVGDGVFGVASHSSFSYGNYLWIIGGYSFQSATSSMRMMRYDFERKIFENVSSGSVGPAGRYGHSSAVYKDSVFLYGGAVKNTATDEFWHFNFTSYLWSHVATVGATKPFAVVGHTAQVVGDLMFIFFGHSPVYGFLNAVQCFSFVNRTWTVLTTSGAIVKGVYGATSVFDGISHTVLIHGGFQSESSNAYSLSDDLFAFDTVNFSWRILRSSGQFRFLHSASLLDRYMFVFGGNTHNDTSVSQGAKCYSMNFMAYDIDCDQWYTLDPPSLDLIPSRFGHSANVYNNGIYIFGGFNGLLLSDLLVYKPGDCMDVPMDRCLSMKSSGLSCVVYNQSQCSNPRIAKTNSSINTVEKMEQVTCPTSTSSVCEKEKLRTCPSCVLNSQECLWCGSECLSKDSSCAASKITSENQCYKNSSRNSLECIYLHNCHACGLNSACLWKGDSHRCELRSSQMSSNFTCESSCFTYSTCESCTGSACMWCGNQQQCVESNAYITSFLYGQCMEWATQPSKCPATRCADLKTCTSCQQNPSCGWCDDGTNTGLGLCMDGGLDGSSIALRNTCASSSWYFTSCPLCQCNGHSSCSRNSSVCLSCNDLTTGLHCEKCQDGFWGYPIAGGNCSACECNNQADLCNSTTGVCYCRTRGVVGDHCQECDKAHKYYGDPHNGGTCYYEMTIDYIFTFNLSSEENKHYTQINFMSTPPSTDTDIDFSITCSANASMNVSVKTYNSTGVDEQFLFLNESCRSFSYKFSHKQFSFGPKYNLTFCVYVYDFQTPFTLQMFFSQIEQLDLFRFFITFFSCFFSLLLIAFVSWKLKQRYDQYRRSQRHIQEMTQMANRPFSSCILELDSCRGDQKVISREQHFQRSSGHRKKEYKATAVTLEPLFSQRAAILSVIVRLPKGDEDYTPSDQSGLAIGSALVMFDGHSRQSSIDPAKPERTNKHRKKPNAINTSPDVV